MADVITQVTTLDIQMLDESRGNATLIKLDNPISNVTREQVSAAMQPAFTNGWFLTSKGNVAMYLGDVTINQSIKTKLGGEDFYITPSSLSFGTVTPGVDSTQTVTCSGAAVQGANIANVSPTENSFIFLAPVINENNTVNVTIRKEGGNTENITFDLKLIINGAILTVPCTAS